MSHWSSSLGKGAALPGETARGVGGAAGEPAWTAVEKGEEAAMEDVVDNVLFLILDVGRRQSRGS